MLRLGQLLYQEIISYQKERKKLGWLDMLGMDIGCGIQYPLNLLCRDVKFDRSKMKYEVNNTESPTNMILNVRVHHFTEKEFENQKKKKLK